MKFLRNTWYIAAWAEDLTDKPLGKRFLNEPVVLYRKGDGTAVAIGDRCPHRFAPLHLGKLKGDTIECPYHGLQYDSTGRCVHNPHGDGKIPQAAYVNAYPLVERHSALWIWMGDPALADADKIVDITQMTHTGKPFKTVRGYVHVNANYQLIIDNLLDLSHATYLHPAFQVKPGPNSVRPNISVEMKQDGDTVWSYFWANGGSMNPFYGLQWGASAPERGDVRNHMRWDAPAVLQLDSGMTIVGGTRDQGPSAPSMHIITPETDHSAHYYWCISHDTQVDNPQITATIKGAIADAFTYEDEPMVAACHEMMQGAELLDLNPVLLPGDSAAMRARRVLAELIERDGRNSSQA